MCHLVFQYIQDLINSENIPIIVDSMGLCKTFIQIQQNEKNCRRKLATFTIFKVLYIVY